jgi:hypothetical protein
MKKALKISIVVLVLIFAAAQFIRPEMENPPIDPAMSLSAVEKPPGDVDLILTRACADCHSNATKYPAYASITPVNFFMAGHIKDGRKHLNFDEWGTYSAKKRAKKYEEICEMVQTREMPLPSYLWLHGESALSDADIQALCDWSRIEAAKIESANAAETGE